MIKLQQIVVLTLLNSIFKGTLFVFSYIIPLYIYIFIYNYILYISLKYSDQKIQSAP